MSGDELMVWRGRMVAALRAVGIEGVRGRVAEISAGEIKAACLACELAASRVQRGLDRRPVDVDRAIALGRAVRFVDGAEVTPHARRDGKEEMDGLEQAIKRRPLPEVKKVQREELVAIGVLSRRGPGSQGGVSNNPVGPGKGYCWRTTVARRERLAKVMDEAGTRGIGMTDLLRKLGMNLTSHTRLMVDLKAVAAARGVEVMMARDHSVRGRRVTVSLGSGGTRPTSDFKLQTSEGKSEAA